MQAQGDGAAFDADGYDAGRSSERDVGATGARVEGDRANLDGRKLQRVIARAGVGADAPRDGRVELQVEYEAPACKECEVVVLDNPQVAGRAIKADRWFRARIFDVGAIKFRSERVAACHGQRRRAGVHVEGGLVQAAHGVRGVHGLRRIGNRPADGDVGNRTAHSQEHYQRGGQVTSR